METITRKEAFECAVAQMIAISQVVNKGKEKLYDYALCLQKGSLDPIVCLKPGESFKWKNIEPGKYIIFGNKEEWYHMVCLINNTIYDKNENYKEINIIKIYKQM